MTVEQSNPMDMDFDVASMSIRQTAKECVGTLCSVYFGKPISSQAVGVLLEVVGERVRRWGGSSQDDMHTASDWMRWIAMRCYDESGNRKRFVEIAALAIAAIESIDRAEGRSTHG